MANTDVSRLDRPNPLDDLLRKSLKVKNINDAQEISRALLMRYPAEKSKIGFEAAGLPVPSALASSAAVSATGTRNVTEEEYAGSFETLKDDLQILVDDPAFRNFSDNLKGWSRAVQSLVIECADAARRGADSIERDKVFGFRRILGDHARFARYLGTENMQRNDIYRRIGRTLDNLSFLSLVMMGEAISKQSFAGIMLQVSSSEMQDRRDAVINTLRNLIGASPETFDDETWGRGIMGYFGLYQLIQQRNQQDLLSLFDEPTVTAMLNRLIEQVSGDTAGGPEVLNAAAQSVIDKIDRLLMITNALLPGQLQPPLNAFLEALRLFENMFLDARLNRAGRRLSATARPPVVFYGSTYYEYNCADEPARHRLLGLVYERGYAARQLDDYLQNDPARIIGQIYLDQLLYCVDRAIDQYGLGEESWGPAERRASASICLVVGLLSSGVQYIWPGGNQNRIPYWAAIQANPGHILYGDQDLFDSLYNILEFVSPENLGGLYPRDPALTAAINQEIIQQNQTLIRWGQFVTSITG